MSTSFILGLIAVFVFGTLTISFFVAAIKVLFSDTAEYRKNRTRSKSWLSVVKGDLLRDLDGKRDSVVQAGIGVNSKNEWIEQGRLSEDSIHNILRN